MTLSFLGGGTAAMGVTRPTARQVSGAPIFGHAGEELINIFCFGDAPRPHGHQSDRGDLRFPQILRRYSEQ